MIINPFIKHLNKEMTFFCVWWVGVCNCGRSLSVFRKDRKTHIRYVCGVRCWWAVPVLEVWLVRALFIACKLCWDYNLRAFCTVLKLYSVCLPRMQTGRFPEDKSQSCRFGQLCRGLWARTRDVHWTHWQTSIYFYADADVLLINQSSSTYIPTCKDRPWLHYRPGGGVNKIGRSNSPEITQYNNGTLALLQDGLGLAEELYNLLT